MPSDLRCSDADREATVGRLRVAAMEGRLDAEELSERIGKAYESKWCRQLDALTADVTPVAPAPAAPAVGPRVYVPRATRVNGLAIASLVASLVWAAWIGSVAAIVLGHIALSQIKASGGRQSGRGLAIGGIVIGWFSVLTLFVGLLGATIGRF